MNSLEKILATHPMKLSEPLVCVLRSSAKKIYHTSLLLNPGKEHPWEQRGDGSSDRKKKFKPGDRVLIDEQFEGAGAGGIGVVTSGPDGTNDLPIQRLVDENGHFIGLYHETFLSPVGKMVKAGIVINPDLSQGVHADSKKKIQTAVRRLFNRLSTRLSDEVRNHVKKCVACEGGDCELLHKLVKNRKLEGRTTFQGLNISIENDKGSTRSGTHSDGTTWSVTMQHPYGYIRMTEGVDGDHVDCFIGPNPNAKYAYVVHTNDNSGAAYDEDKCMLGFDSVEEALSAFLANYSDAKFFRHIEMLPMAEFKEKVLATRGNPIPLTIAAAAKAVPSRFEQDVILQGKMGRRLDPVDEFEGDILAIHRDEYDKAKEMYDNDIWDLTLPMQTRRDMGSDYIYFGVDKSVVGEALAKADQDDIRRRLEEIMEEEFGKLPPEIEDALLNTALAGAAKGLIDLSVSDSSLTNRVNQLAGDWARNRAAEMVGMKWDGGDLIANPEAKWSIAETTRTQINQLVTQAFLEPTGVDALASLIEEAGSFSPDRAEMIARTEIKNAATQANWLSWVESGLVSEVSFLNSSVGHVCQLCIDLAEGSPYPIDSAPHPVSDTHPNCRCSLSASGFTSTKADYPVALLKST